MKNGTDKMNLKEITAGIALVVASVFGISALTNLHLEILPPQLISPRKLIYIADINGDGIQDVQHFDGNNNLVTKYGILNAKTGKTEYVTAAKLKELNPDSKLDYESLEKVLNGK